MKNLVPVVHGGVFTHHNQIFSEGSNSIEDFRRVNTKDLVAQNLSVDEPPMLWQKPSIGFFKVNWDTSVNTTHGCIGMGIIVRDYMGVVLAARNTTLSYLVDPVLAKAKAALHVVKLCREMGFLDIILEGDALQVFNAVNMVAKNLSRLGHFIDGIKEGLR